MAILSVRDLRLAFGDRNALDGLSFDVNAGEVFGLVGPNGAGKSTTINVICGIIPPDEGTVTVDGRAHTEVSRQRLGIVPQDLAIYRDLTALQNLEFFGAIYGLDPRDRRKRAEECLDSVGLLDRAGSRVSQLSGGMQRRLHVAAALLHRPPLLILDEPTVGLDLEIRQRMWNLIVDLKREGTAILLTTHHLEEAELLCTRMGVINEGRIAAQGSLEELRKLITAEEIAVVGSDDLDAVRRKAAEKGLALRDGHESVDLWLPQKTDIRAVASELGDVRVTSIRLRPVGLSDVFAEVCSVRLDEPV